MTMRPVPVGLSERLQVNHSPSVLSLLCQLPLPPQRDRRGPWDDKLRVAWLMDSSRDGDTPAGQVLLESSLERLGR